MATNPCTLSNRPAPRAASDLAIVGGGAAAVALVSCLARSVKRHSVRAIDVFDVDGVLGPGKAYRTPSAAHLMNTPFKHCSIVPGDPGHLEKWLTDRGRPRPLYLSRQVYGEYLCAAGEEAAQGLVDSQGRVCVHKAEILDIDCEESGAEGSKFVLRSLGGREYRAQNIVLALGDPPPATMAVAPHATYYASPWPFEQLRSINARATVAIAGTGASAIDCCLHLAADLHHRGPIQVWSRSGQLPCVQRDPARPSTEILRSALDALVMSGVGPLSLAQLKRAIDSDLAAMLGEGRDTRKSNDAVARFRAEIGAAEAGTPSHQDYVRGLRDLAPALWKRLSPEDQRAFDENYSSLWNRYRHPVALGVARPFLKLLEQGRVQLMRGTPRGWGAGPQVVINATGQDFAVERSESLLVRNILQRGLAKPHPRGGFRVDNSLGVHASGRATRGLYALGALTRGSHFAVASIHALVAAAEVLCTRLSDDATANPGDSSQQPQ